MAPMQIYSPSRTKEFAQCPLLMRLNYDEGYQLRDQTATKSGPAMAAGSAISRAAELINKGVNPDLVSLAVMDQYDDNIAASLDAGIQFNETHTLDTALALNRAVIRLCGEWPILFNGWTIRDQERPFPEHGNARPDLVGVDPSGVLSVVDFKFKVDLAASYRESTLQDYENDWQMYHYLWAGSEYYGQPIYRYYICLVVGNARGKTELIPYEAHPETMAMWLASAKQIWSDMEGVSNGTRIPTMAALHRTRYGLCSMYKACFKYHLDPGLMASDYVQIERKR